MKRSVLLCFLLIAASMIPFAQKDSPKLTDPYLGQMRPGMTLEIFAPGIVTTDKSESAITVSPDLKEVYFLRKSPKVADNRVWYSRVEKGKLTRSRIAPFSYDCMEGYPCFTPDGKRLYFISLRPAPGQDQVSEWGNIWFADKEENSWSEPKFLDSPINDLGPHYLSMDNKGTLYFGSGVMKCIYCAKGEDGGYSEAIRLPDEINNLEGVSHPGIAPDGSYLMVDSFWRENDRIEGSLFISFKRPDGSWTKAIDMKNVLKIDDSYIWCSATVTPDGKYIFVERFIQEESKSDLFWVRAEIVEQLKPDVLERREHDPSRKI
ncbi:MAG: hypothetical protein PVI66_01055 [Candidatus Aminicenantes bacterium]